MSVYQWIMQDNGETCVATYIVTRKFFATVEEVNKYYSKSIEECLYTVIGPLEISRVDGELAEILLKDRH